MEWFQSFTQSISTQRDKYKKRLDYLNRFIIFCN
jgi:hypothetical protein